MILFITVLKLWKIFAFKRISSTAIFTQLKNNLIKIPNLRIILVTYILFIKKTLKLKIFINLILNYEKLLIVQYVCTCNA